ncbi:hypothetical protein NXV73_00210 [Bacteroides salyersiae]|nr:hypothetical protein [Bacteroides salyersiae]
MAKLSGGKPQIDEDFMKEIISQGLPVKKQRKHQWWQYQRK